MQHHYLIVGLVSTVVFTSSDKGLLSHSAVVQEVPGSNPGGAESVGQ